MISTISDIDDSCQLHDFTYAALQYCGKKKWQDNFTIAKELILAAYESGAQMIGLPECANSVNLAATAKDYFYQNEDRFLEQMCELACQLGITLHLGSVILRDSQNHQKCCNRGFIINSFGKITAHYDKIHLFDVNLPNKTYRESDKFIAGKQAVIAETDFGKIGMSICYDLRFPELYTHLALQGANMIAVPAAFTALTGKVHWEILLRARAIENGVYILAPAQTGTHEDGRKTWGHAMIISPWGEIIAKNPNSHTHSPCDDQAFILAKITKTALVKAQTAIPRLQQIVNFA